VIPWEKKGNTLEETIQVCKWIEEDGADAIHVSLGSLFPHPLNPPGDFDFQTIANTYDTMLSGGIHTFRDYLLFRYRVLRPIFRWIWFRMKRGRPVEGVGLEEAAAIRAAVGIPVISTGGYQNAELIRYALRRGACDAVSIARPLIANPDLVRQFAAGRDLPEKPCTFCNKCLLNAPKNPLGCYELSRFESYDAMIDSIMSVYQPRPELRKPSDHPLAGLPASAALEEAR
jgi:2,4-dienoyl-CoA reductase (NADPH2)